MSSELRYTANTQLEHLHARYTGTGHADIAKYDWVTHQHRDTLASIVGHPSLTSYLAIADGEAIGRVKFEMTEKAADIDHILPVCDAMAAIGTQGPLAQYIFPPPALPQQSREKKPTQRRPGTSHYRPFSQVVFEDLEDPQPRSTKLSRRNSISFLMSLPGYPLREKGSKCREKGKERENTRPRTVSSHPTVMNERRALAEKERTPPPRRGLTSKASVNSLNHVIDILPQRIPEDSMVPRTEDTYVPKRVWHRYGSMTMHPYPRDAVYMQSYDPIMLENEKYSYMLLRRLTSSIPTFSTSMDKPPSTVLDLGCGQGHWLLDACYHWPSAFFTGFDLVDILLPELQECSNVQLLRGNFVKHKLPFPDRSFDFVRMANLGLAIPHERWSFAVAEARRVLTAGGQLEIIDDEISFPYGAFPVVTPSSPHSQGSPPPRSRHRRSNTTGADSDTSSPTLRGSEIADSDCTLIDESVPESHLATMGCQRRSLAYLQQWATGRQISQDVEETFTGMLRKRLVHPFPQDFVPDLLRYTFGNGNVGTTQTFDISLAPTSSDSSTPPHPGDPPASVIRVNKLAHPDQDSGDHLGENDLGSKQNSPTRASLPLRHSAKAAGRLGISYSDLVVATASARRPVAEGVKSYQYSAIRGPSQSPGIIIAPSTFIPLTATETEFHACKWIHTVLGCRPAIFDYVRSHVDEVGRRLVSDAELKDALWAYESFRRQRFHWPTDPEHDSESFATPCIANTKKLDLQQLVEARDKPVHIRTIRVYHATKTDMTSLASLLFNSPNQ
ncbi:hypothetical protein NP233_g3236 [Leucocoprinus birnbaumii]|uniref:Methyltransferase domain-containing protein n=1 Tax=Leucocoprinus birnbaumii TaxID=56174 RepID=A0AAD5VYA6_9AGAR|nr:hypothetical protein NP233_g3236 [Leucocoprinus birnbaumii]